MNIKSNSVRFIALKIIKIVVCTLSMFKCVQVSILMLPLCYEIRCIELEIEIIVSLHHHYKCIHLNCPKFIVHKPYQKYNNFLQAINFLQNGILPDELKCVWSKLVDNRPDHV